MVAQDVYEPFSQKVKFLSKKVKFSVKKVKFLKFLIFLRPTCGYNDDMFMTGWSEWLTHTLSSQN